MTTLTQTYTFGPNTSGVTSGPLAVSSTLEAITLTNGATLDLKGGGSNAALNGTFLNRRGVIGHAGTVKKLHAINSPRFRSPLKHFA